MTKDEAMGQTVLDTLGQYTPPLPLFIDGEAKKLYKLEEKRNEYIHLCANEWAVLTDTADNALWFVSIPQVLHDTLDSFQVESAIVAAEAFLKRFGWRVERPERTVFPNKPA